MKGKNLTVAQKKLLNKYGIFNAGDWLYVKTITKSDEGNKRYIVIMHKHTSNMREIPMEQ